MNHMVPSGHVGQQRWRLLADCAALEHQPGGLDATALRTASVRMRDIFVAEAIGQPWTFSGLRSWVLNHAGRFRPSPGDMPVPDIGWLARLARVVALQNLEPDDRLTALCLYHLIHDHIDVSNLGPTHAKLYCDLMLWAGEDIMLREVIQDLGLAPAEEGLVRADLENPHRGGPLAKPEHLWRSRFHDAARLPTDVKLRPTDGGARPFDLLCAESVSGVIPRATTLVTVIMNVFRPDSALYGAVQSLLAQTWQEFEILIIDDGSGVEFAELFNEVADLDPRIRLIPLQNNVGAYGARNVALDHARGTYITFQDYDDWSLPHRLARQIEVIEADTSVVATRARTTKLYEDLTLAHPGYRPNQIHAASLLFRREEVMLGIGYFDAVRKGADNEFYARIMAHFGPEACLDMPKSQPSLMAYRRTEGSLSRNEFRPGWRHPDRSAYRSSYLYWHRNVRRQELFLETDSERRFPAPRRFLRDPIPVGKLDVVVVADWRPASPYGDVAVDVVTRLVHGGGRVGVLALESIAMLERNPSQMADAVLELAHNGRLQVVQGDAELQTRLVVVIDPAVLQFADSRSVSWQVDEAWIVDPGFLIPSAPRTYLHDECLATAQSVFGVAPQWVEDAATFQLELTGHLEDGSSISTL